MLNNKTILITGGTGSFGKKIRKLYTKGAKAIRYIESTIDSIGDYFCPTFPVKC